MRKILEWLFGKPSGIHYQGNTIWIDVEVAEARVREAAAQHRALWDHWVALSRKSGVAR
jgi:hypothetical protein